LVKIRKHSEVSLLLGDFLAVRSSETYLVGDEFEAHAGGVEGGSLLGVANPEANVVESVELANVGLVQH